MKKKLITMLLTIATLVSLTACGSEEDVNTPSKKENHRPSSLYDNHTLDGIISGIETDFEDTIQYLNTQFEETNAKIGDTYEGYIENKQLLSDWYQLVCTEETALFERTKNRAIEYFKLISSSIQHTDKDSIEDAMDNYYDQIYDGVMDDFYDDIYDDLMDDVYDVYYDGIVEEGYDVDPYEKWSDESSECYTAWSNASSSIYKEWSATCSTLYRYWSAVNSGFYKNNFDIDSILAEYQESKKENEETEPTVQESNTNSDLDTSNSVSTELSSDFKEAMESYEAFFDEYVEFMNEYASADTGELITMLDSYADYMKQYTETMKKFEELDTTELSTEEMLYYTEVSSRISKKLLEIEY